MSRVRRIVVVLSAVAAVPLGAVADDAAALWTRSHAVGANGFATDTLDPPTQLDADGGPTVTLTWTPTVDLYATGYRISRSTASGGPYTVVATVTPRTDTLHVDDPPTIGTYYYVVEAVSGGWTSARSNEASALAL